LPVYFEEFTTKAAKISPYSFLMMVANLDVLRGKGATKRQGGVSVERRGGGAPCFSTDRTPNNHFRRLFVTDTVKPGIAITAG
jgi:hypothetical protein